MRLLGSATATGRSVCLRFALNLSMKYLKLRVPFFHGKCSEMFPPLPGEEDGISGVYEDNSPLRHTRLGIGPEKVLVWNIGEHASTIALKKFRLKLYVSTYDAVIRKSSLFVADTCDIRSSITISVSNERLCAVQVTC